jgi:hypothetical protein
MRTVRINGHSMLLLSAMHVKRGRKECKNENHLGSHEFYIGYSLFYSRQEERLIFSVSLCPYVQLLMSRTCRLW